MSICSIRGQKKQAKSFLNSPSSTSWATSRKARRPSGKEARHAPKGCTLLRPSRHRNRYACLRKNSRPPWLKWVSRHLPTKVPLLHNLWNCFQIGCRCICVKYVTHYCENWGRGILQKKWFWKKMNSWRWRRVRTLSLRVRKKLSRLRHWTIRKLQFIWTMLKQVRKRGEQLQKIGRTVLVPFPSLRIRVWNRF